MMQRQVTATVGECEAGVRLDYWLAKRFTYNSRRQWQKRVRDGSILLNGNTTRVSKMIQSGDFVDYRTNSEQEPDVYPHFTIVYEDDEVMIVNKSGNLPCHPAGKFFRNTLWYLLKQQVETFWIVNRLDRETSGLVVLAKTIDSVRCISEQFASRKVEKTYLVIVEGSFPDYLSVKGYLADNPNSKIRKQKQVTNLPARDSESVITHFNKIEEHNGLSLLRAVPKTGRMHQIRATLYSAGYPIVGDKIYGVVPDCYLRFISHTLTKNDRLSLRVNRQALHAYELIFSHSITKKRVVAKAPIPDDLQRILKTHGFSAFPGCW